MDLLLLEINIPPVFVVIGILQHRFVSVRWRSKKIHFFSSYNIEQLELIQVWFKDSQCATLPAPDHALVAPKYNGAILMFFCEPGYILIGSGEIYCNGKQWNVTAPYCRGNALIDIICIWYDSIHPSTEFSYRYNSNCTNKVWFWKARLMLVGAGS